MSDFVLFIFIGFGAQLVDGAIGMAYGLISTSALLSVGLPPATASASVHAAEVFTTCASGVSHWRLKNINWDLVKRLVPAGMLGGFIGAYVLATHDNKLLTLFVSAYLIIMGAVLLLRGLRKFTENSEMPRRIPILGFFGGLLDAIGGGGWGPLVTSHLIGKGTHPRMAIGSTSLAEFFVTVTITATFLLTIGLELWPIITGLIIGGVLAAPIAAYAAKHLPAQALMIVVGLVIMLLSLRTVLVTSLDFL
jgi:hypothetical protein